MRRNLGLVDVMQAIVPESLALPVAILTQLGALWFAILILAAVYRYRDREEALVIGSVLLAGTATWRLIKGVYPVPRPVESLTNPETLPSLLQPVFELLVVQGGPGFPSGHAVTTTIVYFMLAMYFAVGTRWQRYLAATAVVALVGLTRITLGVHYVVDVIAGSLIGHLWLGIILLVPIVSDRPRIEIALLAAIAMASINLGATAEFNSTTVNNVIILGVSLFVYAWWHFVIGDRLGNSFDRFS